MISRYPRHWKRLVYDSISGCGEIERKRIEERLKGLDDRMIAVSGRTWDSQREWLANAEKEHGVRPFHAIISRENPGQHSSVVAGNDIEESHPLWVTMRAFPVKRTAEAMAGLVAPLLRIGTRVLFIDPHFRPTEMRFRRPMEAFFKVLAEQTPLPTAEIHASTDAEPKFFTDECKRKLPSLVPKGLTLRVVVWRQRDGDNKFHNRYILTNRGGVSFGTGLDEGGAAETDDVCLLDLELYALRWRQYTGADPPFDLVADFAIS